MPSNTWEETQMTIDQIVVAIFLGLLVSAIALALVPAIVISRKIAREEEDKFWAEFSKDCQKEVDK